MLLFSRHVRQVGREFAAAENAVKTSSSVAPASLMTSEAMSMVLVLVEHLCSGVVLGQGVTRLFFLSFQFKVAFSIELLLKHLN